MGEKEEPIRIGIDIGGTDTKIGLVDKHNMLLANTVVPTGKEDEPEQIIQRVAQKALELMDEENISVEQCIGAGIGMPGMVEQKAGRVVYSNNIPWEDVPLAEIMGRYLPVPVRAANDADCAALGEASAGSDLEDKNNSTVLLTLGTGVGGGIIQDGKIYSGIGIGGSELGHMVIVQGGEQCTCGRRGCLESYASATAMRREAETKLGHPMEPLEIFNLADEGDEKAEKIVDDYIKYLGTGIVNIINLLRPQRIMLGGGIAAQGEKLLAPIRKMAQRESFGGKFGDVPEIVSAKLGNKAGMIGAANLF